MEAHADPNPRRPQPDLRVLRLAPGRDAAVAGVPRAAAQRPSDLLPRRLRQRPARARSVGPVKTQHRHGPPYIPFPYFYYYGRTDLTFGTATVIRCLARWPMERPTLVELVQTIKGAIKRGDEQEAQGASDERETNTKLEEFYDQYFRSAPEKADPWEGMYGNPP